MKYLIIFLLLFFLGCKSKKEYIYKDKYIDNTEIKHTKETVFTGGKTTTIIPCKEINQVVKLGNTTVKVSAIKDTIGIVKVDIVQKESVSIDAIKINDNKEIVKEREKEIIYKRYIPKYIWYILGVSLLLNIWAYRTQILVFIRKLIIKV